MKVAALLLAGGLGALLARALPRRSRQAREPLSPPYHRMLEQVSGYVICTLDREGRVTSWNAGVRRGLGYGPEETVGRELAVFYTEEDRSSGRPEDLLRRAAAEGRAEVDAWQVRRDGSRFWAAVSLTAFRRADGGLEGFMHIAQDLTERVGAGNQIERLTRLYLVLSQTGQAILRAAPPGDLFREITRICVEAGKFDLAWIGEPRPDGVIERVATAGSDCLAYLDGLVTTVDPALPTSRGPTGTSLREGRPAVVQDWRNDPAMAPWRERAEPYGFQSSCGFPIFREGRPVATLVLYSREPFFFQPDRIQLLEEMTANLGFALDAWSAEERRIQAEADLRTSREQYKTTLDRLNQVISQVNDLVWRTTGDASRILDMSDACERIYGRTADAFRAEPDLWIKAAHPEDRALAMKSLMDLYVLGQVDVQYRIVRSDGLVRWIRDRKSVIRDATGAITELAGVIMDITEQKEAEGIVVAQRDLGLRLSRPGSLEEHMAQCLDTALRISGMDAGSIFRTDPDTGALAGVVHRGLTGGLLELASHFAHRHLSARQHALGQPTYHLGTGDPGQAEGAQPEGLRSLAAFPIRQGERSLGVLFLGSRQDHPVPPRLMPALEVLVAQAAASMGDTAAQEAQARHASQLEQEVLARTRELNHLNQRLQMVLDSTSDGIYGVDAGGICTFVNRSALTLLGFDRAEEALGKPAHPLFHHSRPDGTPYPPEACPVQSALQGVDPGPVESEVLWRRDGTPVAVRFEARCKREGTRVAGAVVTFSDITERRRREEALARAKEAAEAATRAKSAFLANISHEIRTPLNAVLGFSQILLKEPGLTPRQADCLRTINRAGDHLLTLITDVLDLSRIEAGRLTLSETAFDLHHLLEEAVAMFRPRAGAKGLALGWSLGPEVPRWAWGDASKLRQILLNLLGNAVKFTAAGSVHLAAVATPQGAGHRLRLEVEDTGPGIRPEDLGRLFSAFEQAGEGASEGGAGLGLAISRNFARLMGGDIEVSSEVGSGSRFCLVVDLASAEPQSPAPEPPRWGPLVREGQPECRVLIVDDRADNRLLLREILEPHGFTLAEAGGGREALARAGDWAPHLVLMDLQMPDLDGLEAIRRLRAAPGGGAVRIVAVSASPLPFHQEEAQAAGADRFLAKPFREAALLEALAGLLGLEGAAPQDPAGTLPPLDPELAGQIRQAAIRARYDVLLEVCAGLDLARHPAAAPLRAFLDRFDYAGLLTAIDAVEVPHA